MVDADIRVAKNRCQELLKSSTEEDWDKKIVQQFYFTTIHLLTTAEVITNVLHKSTSNNKLKITANELDNKKFYDVSYINEESKTTRRNAHYKSTVLVIFYYLIYFSYYGKPPKHIGYKHIIHNKKARVFMESNPSLLKKLYSTRKLKQSLKKLPAKKLMKKNKIKVVTGTKVEYKSIQHHSQFKQYTYNYRMSLLIDRAMPDLIAWAYEQFNKNCKKYIMINFAKKTKEKQQDDEEKKNKRKPMRFKDVEAAAAAAARCCC